MPSSSKTNKHKLRGVELEIKAVDLRKMGWTYREIGAECGVSHTAARNACNRALDKLNKQSAEMARRYRTLLLRQYNALLKELWPRALPPASGWLNVIDRIVKVLDKVSKLTGAETPQQLRSLNIDLGSLDDEQLSRIATGEDPVFVMATPSAGRAGAPPTCSDCCPESEDASP